MTNGTRRYEVDFPAPSLRRESYRAAFCCAFGMLMTHNLCDLASQMQLRSERGAIDVYLISKLPESSSIEHFEESARGSGFKSSDMGPIKSRQEPVSHSPGQKLDPVYA